MKSKRRLLREKLTKEYNELIKSDKKYEDFDVTLTTINRLLHSINLNNDILVDGLLNHENTLEYLIDMFYESIKRGY